MITPTNTIIINTWDSKCYACGRNASPNEERHDSVLPGYSGRPVEPGCGIEWKYAMSHYRGVGIRKSVERQWPHLIWIGEDD